MKTERDPARESKSKMIGIPEWLRKKMGLTDERKEIQALEEELDRLAKAIDDSCDDESLDSVLGDVNRSEDRC